MPEGWDRFEWDDENRKNGNVQHLREHEIEPNEAEECFFHEYDYYRDLRRFDDVYILSMAAPIAAGACGSFSRTKGTNWLAYSPAGS